MFSTHLGAVRPGKGGSCIDGGAGGCHAEGMNRADWWYAMQLERVSLWNTRRRGGRALLGVLLALSTGPGCGASDPTAVAEGGVTPTSSASSERRAICPNCLRPDVAGNETSDFSGSADPCSGEPAPMPADAPGLDQVEPMRQAYGGSLDLSMRWEQDFDPEYAKLIQSAPTGYAPKTRVSIDVVFGETAFYAGRTLSPATVAECPDFLWVPATLTLATADGALALVADGGFEIGERRREWLHAVANLADAVGTLEVELNPEQPLFGHVAINIDASNGEKQGTLGLRVSSEPNEYLDTERLLDGTFPDDD